MKKWTRVLALMTAIALVSGACSLDAAPQDKKPATTKDDKKPAAKDDKKPAAKDDTKKKTSDKLGTIEVKKNDKGTWRFLIKDSEGKSIVMPLPQVHWETKEECLKAIEDLKATLNGVKPVEVKN